MEQSAILRQAYSSNGLRINGGGTFTLPKIVGLVRSLEIAWGLVTKIVDDGTVLEETVSMRRVEISPTYIRWLPG